MPDLERWLTEIERRHRTQGEYLDFVNGGIHQQRCRGCMQDWPCDAHTLARVVREQAKALETIKEKRDLSWDIVREVDQRIAAIISGEEAGGE